MNTSISFDRILEIGFPNAIVIFKDETNDNYNPYLDRISYSYKILIEDREYLLKITEITNGFNRINTVISSLTMPDNQIIFRMNRTLTIRLLFEKLK